MLKIPVSPPISFATRIVHDVNPSAVVCCVSVKFVLSCTVSTMLIVASLAKTVLAANTTSLITVSNALYS